MRRPRTSSSRRPSLLTRPRLRSTSPRDAEGSRNRATRAPRHHVALGTREWSRAPELRELIKFLQQGSRDQAIRGPVPRHRGRQARREVPRARVEREPNCRAPERRGPARCGSAGSPPTRAGPPRRVLRSARWPRSVSSPSAAAPSSGRHESARRPRHARSAASSASRAATSSSGGPRATPPTTATAAAAIGGVGDEQDRVMRARESGSGRGPNRGSRLFRPRHLWFGPRQFAEQV